VVTGRATLTRGTMRVTGERMELRTSPEGYRSALVTAGAEGPATFRQRRDPTRPGVEEYVEGSAERIEWDEKTDSVRFVNKAQWRRLENGVVRDEISGQVIAYDAAASTYRIEGGESGGGRVRAVIAPRTSDPAKAPPAPLRPATEPPAGRK
jgi:lipopolysaccharide export system protein LptA